MKTQIPNINMVRSVAPSQRGHKGRHNSRPKASKGRQRWGRCYGQIQTHHMKHRHDGQHRQPLIREDTPKLSE